MAILKIAKMGHPILLQKAKKVDDPTDPKIKVLVDDMSKEQNNNESENVLEIMDKLNSSNTSNDNSSFGSDVSDEVLILRERMLAAEDALRIEIENRKNDICKMLVIMPYPPK